MSNARYHKPEGRGRSKRGALPFPAGTIVVEPIMVAAWDADHQEFLARARRRTEAFEEGEVLRTWWHASDHDRPKVVSRNREVFERIHRKRREAARIEAEDRRFQDRRMRRAGYRVRPGDFPRYVRS